MDDNGLKTYHTPGVNPFTGVTGPVTVPFLQAAITGALAGITAGVLAALMRLPVSAWGVAGGIWALVTLASWLSYRGRWQRVIEQALGVDLDGDGHIGEPRPELPPAVIQPLRVELLQDGARQGEFIDLPYPDKLPALAAGLLAGRKFTQTAWTGAGQLFSRAEFENLRGELLRRNLARWKNADAPAQGIELTPAGRAVLRRVAGRDDSHSPTRTAAE